jgi:hypothetical protein
MQDLTPWMICCKVEPDGIWLAASTFIDAIKETHVLASVRLNGRWMNLWVSQGWDVIWAAGPHELKWVSATDLVTSSVFVFVQCQLCMITFFAESICNNG